MCCGSYCLSLTLPSCVQPLCIYCSFAAHLHKRQIINTHPAQSVCCVCSRWFREVYLIRWKMQPRLYFNLDSCAHPVLRLTSRARVHACICLRPHLDANGRRRRRDGDKERWRRCLETERLDAAEQTPFVFLSACKGGAPRCAEGAGEVQTSTDLLHALRTRAAVGRIKRRFFRLETAMTASSISSPTL